MSTHGLHPGPARASADRRAARAGRARARARAALSARVLRRAAPAHRHRPRARGRAALHRRRRAGVGARRVDPGAGDQPAVRPARAVRPDDAVHLARPRRRRIPVRPHRRALSRQGDGGRAGAAALYASPLHPYTRGAARGVAAARTPTRGATRRRCRATSRARWIRLRAACSAPAARTRSDACAATVPPLARSRAGPFQGLPPRRHLPRRRTHEPRSDPLPKSLDAHDQGLSARAPRRCRLRAIGGQGWNVLRGDLPLPLAVIRESALAHNHAWMRDFTAADRRAAGAARQDDDGAADLRAAARRRRLGHDGRRRCSSSPSASASACAASSWPTSCSARSRSAR